MNEIKYEMDLDEPPQELLDWARDNLKENPETRCQVISDLRDMIYARGECIPLRTDDAFLLRYLRAREFTIERAHRLFVNYHEFRENNPDFFNIDLAHLKRMGDDKIITVPPLRETSGRRLILYRMGNWDPEKYSVNELFQATLAILEIAIMEQRAQILGGICIMDLGGITMQQAWHMTPTLARKMVQIMVTCNPMKIHAIHIVNQSYVFDVIFNCFKPFLTDLMRERIFFHGDNMESLHQHVEPKFLPERYGGIHEDFNYKAWIDVCRQHELLIHDLKALGYTDSDLEEGRQEGKETIKG